MIFFVLISVLRGIRVVLVIGPFITSPARHSAVGVNAIPPDSHNYPKIEKYLPQQSIVGQREFKEIHKERGQGCSVVLLQADQQFGAVSLDPVNICGVNVKGINLHSTLQTVKSPVMDSL